MSNSMSTSNLTFFYLHLMHLISLKFNFSSQQITVLTPG